MSAEILEQRFQILREIFNGDAVFNRPKNEVVVFCPKHEHHKRKLSINVAKNEFHCWVCGYSGKKIFYLLRENGSKDQQKKYIETLGIKFVDNKIVSTKLELPKEYKFLLTHKSLSGGIMAANYLYDMGLTDKEILQHKIGFCEEGQYRNRIIFPSYDMDGKLNFFATRRYDDGDYKKYLDCEVKRSDIVFNELLIDWSKPLIIVENVKASVRHSSLNIVPLLGSSLGKDYKLFQEAALRSTDVYLALDPEAKKKAFQISAAFKSYCVNCSIVDLPCQPDEIDTSKFLSYINKATVLSFNDYLIKRLNVRGIN